MSKEKILYAAGIIDADGYIGVVRSATMNGYRYFTPQVMVVNRDVRLMEWFKENFGGKFYLRKKRNDRVADHYMWRAVSSVAFPLLVAIEPFLIVKKKQAQLAIAFQERIYANPVVRKGRPKDKRLVATEELKAREDIYHKFKALNAKGVNYVQPV